MKDLFLESSFCTLSKTKTQWFRNVYVTLEHRGRCHDAIGAPRTLDQTALKREIAFKPFYPPESLPPASGEQ